MVGKERGYYQDVRGDGDNNGSIRGGGERGDEWDCRSSWMRGG
jgi:hypothetical protein